MSARFSIINVIDFGLRKNHMYDKWLLKIRKLVFEKILQNKKIQKWIEQSKWKNNSESSTSPPGGNQVDSLPPASSFFGSKMKIWNMIDHSFSISVLFPQVEMCDEAYIFNAKFSRRIEKSNNYGSRRPKMTKMTSWHLKKSLKTSTQDSRSKMTSIFVPEKSYAQEIVLLNSKFDFRTI